MRMYNDRECTQSKGREKPVRALFEDLSFWACVAPQKPGMGISGDPLLQLITLWVLIYSHLLRTNTLQVTSHLLGDIVVPLLPALGTWRRMGTYPAANFHVLPPTLPLEAAATLCIKCVRVTHGIQSLGSRVVLWALVDARVSVRKGRFWTSFINVSF